MDPQPRTSSSAIDLTGTPTGLAASLPPSPSLVPSDSQQTFSRRRTSWGRVDAGQDPLRLELPFVPTTGGHAVSDDPFYSPVDEFSATHEIPFGSVSARYGIKHDANTYSTAQSAPSTTSLIEPPDSDADSHREDDEAHLTNNMSAMGTAEGFDDPERVAGVSPYSTRRRTARYSLPSSPLQKTGSAFKSVSQNFRRVSLRVVNLGGAGLEHQIRLPDGERSPNSAGKSRGDVDEDELPDLSLKLPIRGRTLGFLGPTSKLRLALYRFLVYSWTEPIILLLIIVNTVVLTIQASSSLTLPTPDGNANPSPVTGYFHTWEDYTLFVLFVVFTLEAFARICVSGFLLDPDISVYTLFTSPFSTSRSEGVASNTPNPSSLSRQTSHLSQGPLTRGLTITQRLQRINDNISRPFELYDHTPPTTYAHNERLPRPRSDSTKAPMKEKVKTAAKKVHSHIRNPSQPTFLSTVLKSDQPAEVISLPFRLSIINAHDKTRRSVPYLRQSWTRIDFIAIVGFWVSFGLAIAGLERGTHHIGVFRALSVMRTTRLLTITSGTTTIMHSLKTAAPLLTSVAYFVLFAIVLFSVIGIQSFKGSLRRSCVLQLGDTQIQLSFQCGGHIDPVTLQSTSYIDIAGNNSMRDVKGHICPLGQVCQEAQNPMGGVESFDTIYDAALQMVVVASANTWSTLMYSVIDAEFFVSCFFFILGIIVLNFWLINLFVAVITHTFSAIRSQTQKSAFGAAPLIPLVDEDQVDGWPKVVGRRASKINYFKTIYDFSKWYWVLLALISLVLQATRTVDISDVHQSILDKGELIITIAFDVEIILRFLATFPDWRSFFVFGQNWLDLSLAIGSSIIQIPAIHSSKIYPWFTIVQLARFYRVILEVPRMRPLLLAVFGNLYGLVNMTLFLMLINFIAALVGVQLLRGDMNTSTPMNFGQIFNSFLAMYQVFSSENWTTVLYNATSAELALGQTAIVALFLSIWILFANFIVLQMFIAVINENFDVAEESKKGRQASDYWATHQPQTGQATWLRRLNPYRWIKANPVRVKVENLPPNLVLPMQKALVQDYAVPRQDDNKSTKPQSSTSRSRRHYPSKSLTALQQLFAGDSKSDDVALATIRPARNEATRARSNDEETDRHLELLAAVNSEAARNEEISDALYERRAQKADFIRDHPTYDKTFWIFSQKNVLRRFCQKLVQPANGERIFGTPHSPIAYPIFQLLLFLTVVGGIVVESIATPIYRRNFYADHGRTRDAWFDIAEAAFCLVLVTEFIIKLIADGLVFTPNAYVRSIWNVLDLFILIGLLVNTITALVFIGGLSRLTRSLKALRALRLITLFHKIRDTFQSLIISGAIRILDAAVLAILYMIPYAVWGLNIFSGVMNECNDTSVNDISGCTSEFVNNALDNVSLGYPIPRVWNNPAPSTVFSFDNFQSSFLILFEIVSLEGWIDVMVVATSITGKNQQPQTNASQGNAIFFVIYNLLGGVVILTLFVSIIIGNFKSKTGSAFLTQPQQEWIDLQKLFKRQKPSKRPKHPPTSFIRAWCYDRAVSKHGWWARSMTFLFILHVFALMTQTFSTQSVGDTVRNDFFLVITFVYIIDVLIRLFGLGWRSFRDNGWNLFDIVIAGGSFVTTLIVRFGTSGFLIQQLQKLFLVSIAFKLVQRTNSLNKLFKTAMASLPVILRLLGLWIILFLFFAILYMEVFGLTKWNSGETRNQNYASLPTALVMLAFMTTGEGWNQFMHDYAIVYPRCTNSSAAELDSDCGSVGWAYTLFIAWNLLSMYIFVNMFTGVVVENFSYVFQASGGSKSITREEMRAFKKVWAEFANPKTGYLERQHFVPFFAKLRGVFEVRIYPVEYSVRNVVTSIKNPEYSRPGKATDGIDVHKLLTILGHIDYTAIRRRRLIYSRLYHEASISHQQGRGISFTDMLLLLAHHKLIVDRDALVLDDLVMRTETNKLVTDLVNLDRVRSLLRMISHRRRFLALKANMDLMKMEQDIPSIVVDTLPTTPPQRTRDITASSESRSPSPRADATFNSPDVSLGIDKPTSAGLQRSRRTSDMSMLSSMDIGSPSAEEDLQHVLSSMQNSMWGDLMQEVAEEEHR